MITPKSKYNITFLNLYLKEHSYSIFIAYFCTILLAIVSTLIANSIGPSLQIFLSPPEKQYTISELLGHNFSWVIFKLFNIKSISSKALLQKLPYFLIIVSGLKALLLFTQTFIWESISEKTSKKLRNDLFESYIFDSPYNRFYSNKKQELDAKFSSIVTTDIKLLREYIVHFWGAAPREILQAIFLSFSLVMISSKLCIMFFLFLIPAGYIIRVLGKRLKNRTHNALSSYSMLSEWLQQRLLGIETIKQYKTEDLENKKFISENEKLFQKLLKAFRTKAQASPLIEFVSIVAISVILYYSLQQIAEQSLTGSIAISFFSTTALLGQSLGTIGRHFNTSKEGSAATHRIQKTFEETNHKKTDSFNPINFVAKETNMSSLSCEKIYIKYPSSKNYVIENFSYVFEKGKIYCITGASGVGKSSLIKAFLGIIPTQKGKINYFAPIKSQKNIGYLPQNVLLSPCSIAENISYPKLKPDLKKVEIALKKVDLWNTVNKLPKKLQTKIGSYDKSILSGGQNQRILFARLLYHAFPFVIIDEGTSALDQKTQKLLYSCLFEMKSKYKTSIILVSHKASDIKIADAELNLNHK